MICLNPCFTLAALALASLSLSAAATSQKIKHPLEPEYSSPLIALHKSLVEYPSISGSEANVTGFLNDYLQQKGFTVQTQTVSPDRQNLLAYLGSSPKTRILVTSHIDTVPPYIPYSIQGDTIWGRGTVDAKASVAAQIIAVEELISHNKIAQGDVALLFVVGEETGGAGMSKVNDLGLSWEAVIFGEPTELKLARGHKGGLGLNITAKGKAGHSGYPELGVNAIDMLVRALGALGRLELPWSEEYGNSTLNIGKIVGGVAANVIPADAWATGSVRVAAGTPEGISELIKRVVLDAGPGVEISFTYGTGPVRLDYDIKGFETAVMSYGTDIPRLKGDHKKYLYGPGSILVAHSDHENIRIDELGAAVEGYRTLIIETLRRKRRC